MIYNSWFVYCNCQMNTDEAQREQPPCTRLGAEPANAALRCMQSSPTGSGYRLDIFGACRHF
jgi:hypothetical protein